LIVVVTLKSGSRSPGRTCASVLLESSGSPLSAHASFAIVALSWIVYWTAIGPSAGANHVVHGFELQVTSIDGPVVSSSSGTDALSAVLPAAWRARAPAEGAPLELGHEGRRAVGA
jgi:hypothetical protein